MNAAAPDPIETAMRAGAVHALRKRAAAQRQRAADGSFPAGEHFPGVAIRSPEAALALRLAAGLESIAAAIEAESAS
jgi:hypothetical protein